MENAQHKVHMTNNDLILDLCNVKKTLVIFLRYGEIRQGFGAKPHGRNSPPNMKNATMICHVLGNFIPVHVPLYQI